MNIITAKDLRVKINTIEILHGIDLVVPEGQITVIIGPNGSGKSTTLKALCRLLPYEGSIQYGGKELNNISGKEFACSVAILTQNPQAPDDLTVLDLVKMGRFPHRRLFGGSKKEDAECVTWALQQTGMERMQDRIINTLSGGERQRAWIAMALAQDPKVLFLDEPTSYLDICHQLEIIDLVKKLNKELGLTVVMVLHELTQTLNCAQHVIVIKEGRISNSGGPEIITGTLLQDVFQVQSEEFISSAGQRILVPLCRQ